MLNGWSDLEKGIAFATCLHGPSLEILAELEPEKRTNYGLAVGYLSRYYNPPGCEYVHMTRFEERSMLPTETPAEYAADRQRLALKAYPDFSNEDRNRLTKSRFLRGLDQDARVQISMHSPKTLSETISLATQHYVISRPVQNTSTSTKCLSKPKIAAVSAIHDSTICDAKEHNESGEMEPHLQILKLLNKVVGLLEPRKPHTPCPICRRSGHWARDCPDKATSIRSCYNCGQEGHIQKYCPNKDQGITSTVAKND